MPGLSRRHRTVGASYRGISITLPTPPRFWQPRLPPSLWSCRAECLPPRPWVHRTTPAFPSFSASFPREYAFNQPQSCGGAFAVGIQRSALRQMTVQVVYDVKLIAVEFIADVIRAIRQIAVAAVDGIGTGAPSLDACAALGVADAPSGPHQLELRDREVLFTGRQEIHGAAAEVDFHIGLGVAAAGTAAVDDGVSTRLAQQE